MDASFVMPAPAKERKPRADLRSQTTVVGLLYLRQRHSGMQVDGHAELVEFSQNGVVARIIQEDISGTPNQERTHEAKLLHRTFEFLRCGFRVSPGQTGKSAKAGGIGPQGFSKTVIGLSRELDLLVRRHILRGVAVGKDLHIDSVLIHDRETPAIAVRKELRGDLEVQRGRQLVVAII